MAENKEKSCKTGKANTKVFTFNPSNQTIQVELINQQHWFVAKDICDCLKLQNVTDRLRSLDDDEKLTYVVDRSGQNREVNLVNESGLYNLIFQSRKPEAKKFRKWVTSEVLPSIRKTGSYSVTTKRNNKMPYVCRSTQWRYDNGLLPKTTLEERHGNFDDVRDLPYAHITLLNKPVRTIEYEDENYFSIMDIKKALRISTDTGSIASSLCTVKPFARKLFIFGATSPAWFCTSEGMQLLLSNKAKTNYCKRIESELQKGGVQ